jgi:hypothetical protein
MATIHFISGLPRSGSTLLAALLRQNPRFEAGMSGPLAARSGFPPGCGSYDAIAVVAPGSDRRSAT